MIKLTTLIFGLLLTLNSNAGPFVSSGPIGREFLNCNGKVQDLTGETKNLRIRVRVILGQGIVAQFFVDDRMTVANVVSRNTSDPRGELYMGSPVSVLVPNMQNPTNEPGTYNALVTVKTKTYVTTCQN